MMFNFALISAIVIHGTSAFSFIRDPCIVDTATHDRFNESNLIFTIWDEYLEVHLPTGHLNKRGLIKDQWPEVLSDGGPLVMATSTPGGIHFSKYVSNGAKGWAYKCSGTVYNCTFSKINYSAKSPIHVVAGFVYQSHMPIVPEPPEKVKGGLFAVLPERGPEFLQCGQISKGAKHYQTGCTKYGNEKLNYTSFQLCRGDPNINTLTAISVAYNNETKLVDFVLFFKGLMRYTLDGQFKQLSIHQFVACPLSFKKVSLTLVILTLLGILIGILVFSEVYYKKLRSLSSEDEGITVARR